MFVFTFSEMDFNEGEWEPLNPFHEKLLFYLGSFIFIVLFLFLFR